MLLCLSSLGLNSDLLVAYAVQPRTLRRSDRLGVPVAEEWIKTHREERKYFIGKEKEKNGEIDFCFIRCHYKCLAMRLMCVFKGNYTGRGLAAGGLVMKDWH